MTHSGPHGQIRSELSHTMASALLPDGDKVMVKQGLKLITSWALVLNFNHCTTVALRTHSVMIYTETLKQFRVKK